MALVDIDDVDAVLGPAQRHRPAPQVVLPQRRFGVVGDLVEGRLADVEVGVAAEPLRGDLAGDIGVHAPASGSGWCGRGVAGGRGGGHAGMRERHLRQHLDDGGRGARRQRQAGRRAGITSFRAGGGQGLVVGGRESVGLWCRCRAGAALLGGGGLGGPRGDPGGHAGGGQHAAPVSPAAAGAACGGRAELLVVVRRGGRRWWRVAGPACPGRLAAGARGQVRGRFWVAPWSRDRRRPRCPGGVVAAPARLCGDAG